MHKLGFCARHRFVRKQTRLRVKTPFPRTQRAFLNGNLCPALFAFLCTKPESMHSNRFFA